ncbi:ankyrin repeat and SOCS box protein 9 isoform X1 [Syngnathus scovelli]|uniref:ankyrin repeat and SOCS box protein 9 isoform X1 n=1 Tax=Syngnathus scovelli TaxID=161590 RepID=UPI00211070D8|nr:ankyrin repeat and SOCS box protein 9 isoform X1 [Syngnathus scovelli]
MSGGHEESQSGASFFFSNPLMSDFEADWSPIHDAASNGRMLTLQRLIAQGVCVNLSTLDQVSPLHGASLQGHAGCVKLLLQHGANINSSTLDGRTALSEACGRGHVTCVSLLLRHRARPMGSSVSNSPMHVAASKGYPECIESLAQHGADLDQNIHQSGTPLHVACSSQQLTAVKKLLELGANVNVGRSGESPLHIAARASNPEMVSVLLEHGADTSLQNPEGKRPMDLAASDSAVEKLLRQSAEVPKLMQLCRLHIRTTLGKHRLHSINHLYLPTVLKNYLLWKT